MVYTPGGESDVDLALQKLESIRRQAPRKYFVPAQVENPDNIGAHVRTTAPEIWEQTAGRIDAFIMTQGTGGTLTGVGRYIRRRRKALRLFAIEPAECPLLSRRQWWPHGIEGIGDGFVPKNLDVSLLDGIVTTTTDEAMDMRRNRIFTTKFLLPALPITDDLPYTQRTFSGPPALIPANATSLKSR